MSEILIVLTIECSRVDVPMLGCATPETIVSTRACDLMRHDRICRLSYKIVRSARINPHFQLNPGTAVGVVRGF